MISASSASSMPPVPKVSALGGRAVERVVVAEPVDVHGDRPVVDVGEAQRLDVALHPVDVEIDHDFLERPLLAREEELAARHAPAPAGRLRADVGPVQVAAGGHVGKIDLAIGRVGDLRAVPEGHVVEAGHRRGIEDPPAAGRHLQHVLLVQDLAGASVDEHPPVVRGRRQRDDQLPGRHDAVGLRIEDELRGGVRPQRQGPLPRHLRCQVVDRPLDRRLGVELRRRRRLLHLVQQRRRHRGVLYAVDSVVLVQIDLEPGARYRFALAVLLEEHVRSKHGLDGLVVSQIPGRHADLEVARDAAEKRGGDASRGARFGRGLDVVDLCRRFVHRALMDLGANVPHTCHGCLLVLDRALRGTG